MLSWENVVSVVESAPRGVYDLLYRVVADQYGVVVANCDIAGVYQRWGVLSPAMRAGGWTVDENHSKSAQQSLFLGGKKFPLRLLDR